MSAENKLQAGELRAGLGLAVVFFLRMFALFMLIPVLTLAAGALADARPVLIGLALGIYGLTQAVFQLPFGMLSDKWGRKPVIIVGLLLFILGGIIASLAESVGQLIFARAIQGAGAISASIMALAADLSRAQQRTKMMAMIGASIGVAFALAVIIGPVLYAQLGYSNFFLFSALLALLAIVGLFLFVPTPPGKHHQRRAAPYRLKDIIANAELNRLNAGILISHLILMANFTVLPLALQDHIYIEAGQHWKFYTPVIFISLLFVGPLLFFSGKIKKTRPTLVIAMVLLFSSQLGAAQFYDNYQALMVLMTLFFIAFNYLEAYLPAQVSCIAPDSYKGTALGIYSIMQFLGIFAGGMIGGLLYGLFGIAAVHLACALLALAGNILFLSGPKNKDPVQ